jgi:hypothetical protein
MFITMKNDMKQRYRVFRRGWGKFYCEDLVTKKQESLKTRDRDEANRLVAAKNETQDGPAFSRQLARVYWKAGDPAGAMRNWRSWRRRCSVRGLWISIPWWPKPLDASPLTSAPNLPRCSPPIGKIRHSAKSPKVGRSVHLEKCWT